jgi:hypothetical protein
MIFMKDYLGISDDTSDEYRVRKSVGKINSIPDDLVSLICGYGLTPGKCQLKDPFACLGCPVRLKLLELSKMKEKEPPKLCKTCEFWKQEKLTDRFGTTIQEYDYGLCISGKFVDVSCLYSNAPPTLDAVSITDHEEYQANIYFGPDFGCIHHKRKEVRE